MFAVGQLLPMRAPPRLVQFEMAEVDEGLGMNGMPCTSSSETVRPNAVSLINTERAVYVRQYTRLLCRILANESGCRSASLIIALRPSIRSLPPLKTCAATAWTAAHAAELHPSKLPRVAATSPEALSAVPVRQSAKISGVKIALQVLLCPVTDIAADNPSRREFAEGYFRKAP